MSNGEKCGQVQILFAQRLSDAFGLIQAFHSSLTLPLSHYKHNEWSYVRLRLKHTVYTDHRTLTFESRLVTISVPHISLYFTQGSCVFVPIQAIDISFTLLMSHHKYNEWSYRVGNQIWWLPWSPQAVFESWVLGTNVDIRSTHTFHIKIKCVWSDSSISQQFDPSIVTL